LLKQIGWLAQSGTSAIHDSGRPAHHRVTAWRTALLGVQDEEPFMVPPNPVRKSQQFIQFGDDDGFDDREVHFRILPLPKMPANFTVSLRRLDGGIRGRRVSAVRGSIASLLSLLFWCCSAFGKLGPGDS
jgi:hypothetical protein